MTNDNSASIVSKVWNYAHVLKNARVDYGDYVEQITYMPFLKLAAERGGLDRQISRASRLRLGILTSAFSGEGAFV